MKDLVAKISEKVSEKKDLIADGLEKTFALDNLINRLSEVSDAGREKIAAYTDQLIALTPIIEEIGFSTKSMSISIGLPPSVSFTFEKIKDVAPERRAEILAEHKDKVMLMPIIKTLITADNYQSKIQLGQFKFGTIQVTLGLTPGVNIQLVPGE